jgi:FKBP-type peptidyl-prolyl cis-trans isomerase
MLICFRFFTVLFFTPILFYAQLNINYKFKNFDNGNAIKWFKKGKGEKIKKSERVFVNYSLYHKTDTSALKLVLLNGEKNILVGHEEVLLGWDAAILNMRVGDSALVKIPPKLAYGDKKVGSIQKNSTLYLFIKILKIEQVFFNNPNNNDTLLFHSGLKKIKIKDGKGKTPQPLSQIKINYTGYVMSKKGYPQIFETIESKNIGLVLQLNSGRLVQGLDEGIATMSIGEKATFIVPPSIGFGDQQVGKILPNTTLYYDIELLDAEYPFLDLDLMVKPILTKDSLFIYKSLNSKSKTIINSTSIVTYHYNFYYKTNDGKKILFESSFVNNKPAYHRVGFGIGFPGIERVLAYLSLGDTVTVLVPNKKILNKSSLKFLPDGAEMLMDLYVNNVQPYQFMNLSSNDTVKTFNGLRYVENKSVNNIKVDTVKKGSLVNVYYTIYFFDSLGVKKIIDTSRDFGKPLNFQVGNGSYIKGFEDGVIGMLNRSSRRLLIPPALAYGEGGLSALGVPYRGDIIFDVEFIQILQNEK